MIMMIVCFIMLMINQFVMLERDMKVVHQSMLLLGSHTAKTIKAVWKANSLNNLIIISTLAIVAYLMTTQLTPLLLIFNQYHDFQLNTNTMMFMAIIICVYMVIIFVIQGYHVTKSKIDANK